MLDTCKTESVMGSWVARDSVETSSGNDTSDSGTVSMLIILRLLYSDSCSKCFFFTLVACRVFVFHPVAFSDSWNCVLGSHRVPIRSCNSQLVVQTIHVMCLRPPDQQDPTESRRNATKWFQSA